MKPMNEQHFATLRRHMVEVVGLHMDILEDELGKPAVDERVASAMSRIPRHRFVPEPLVRFAYNDQPLPIGFDKTISQPFICALMTDLLALVPGDSVLEIGTGLGYQSAVLAELAARIWSVEIVEELAESARDRLAALGYRNIDIRVGDGSRGWADHAPYDKIIVAAAHEIVPEPLREQLKSGGRLVMPLGREDAQQLTLVEKDAQGVIQERAILPVMFTRLETII